MALEPTSQERIRPVTGTHVVRVQARRPRDRRRRAVEGFLLPRPAFSTGGYWLGTPGIFPQIHIIQSELLPPGPSAPISPRARHTCFEVADYGAMKATLEHPDGNTLEFQPATA